MSEELWPGVSEYQRDYKVLRQIASGAFGSVHCVQRRDTKVILAAKYVKSSEEDLRREVEALLALRGSSLILQFIAFYVSEPPKLSQSVLITEFLAGGDLIERTSSADYVLNEAKCRTIVRQICRGVEFIHKEGFIHLDIKPFNIVFYARNSDYDLRIIDFGLARALLGSQGVKVGMCGTIEYMSPEVMNCDEASPASDMWGVGVIAYQMCSGGISPFFAVNRFRTMAKVLEVNYSLDREELHKASDEAKDFITQLLVKDPHKRLTASQCLEHPWLRDEKLYLGILDTLETMWMRKCLARRRWYRLFNALRVMRQVKLMSMESQPDTMRNVWNSSSDDDMSDGNNIGFSKTIASDQCCGLVKQPPYVHPISRYSRNFYKTHLIVNNGSFGTVFSVQSKETEECYAARHVKSKSVRGNLMEEASILWQMRNVSEVVQLWGLYEGPNQSVLVTDDLIGGDLAERLCRPDFELNEGKCRRYIQQVCRGLAYVHKNDIVHLDIKPFTLVFSNADEDSDLKITDFVFAKRLTNECQPHLLTKSAKLASLFGTVEFLAPEMIECTYATFASDAWSVGVLSYMLVTGGKSPFYAGNRFKTVARILSCQYDLHGAELKCISREAKSFIQDLLQTGQQQRMSMNQCLQHKWLEMQIEPGETLQALESINNHKESRIKNLETRWMRKLLARRRWQRWYNAVRATQRIKKLSVACSTRACSTTSNPATSLFG